MEKACHQRFSVFAATGSTVATCTCDFRYGSGDIRQAASLGEAGAAGQQRMQGDVVEEVDLQADGDDLAEFRGDAQMLAAGAEVGGRSEEHTSELQSRQ